MKTKSKNFKTRTSLAGTWICFALLLMTVVAKAGKSEVEFRKKQTIQQTNELASNMLRVVNKSNKPLKFLLRLSYPEGWRNLNENKNLYEVAADDSIFIPVKLIFKGNEEGDVSYMVAASLVAESNQLQFASASWYVQISRISEWSASVSKTEAFFINNSDTSSFNLSIRNTGNSPELLSVKISPHFGLQAFNMATMKEITEPFSVLLSPGKDTVFNYTVKLKPVQKERYQTQNSRQPENNSSEKFPLRIAVASVTKNNSAGKVWKSTIEFKKTASEAKFNDYSRQVLPLTAEVRLDNIFENSTIMNINLYGDAKLSRARNLSYRFQSFFIDQYFSDRAFKGNYRYIGYFTPRAAIEAGNISGWGNFGQTPSGEGLKGEYAIGKNRIGLMYIESPFIFQSPAIRSIGARHVLSLKNASLTNYFQRAKSDYTKSNGWLFISGLDFRIQHQHVFSLRAGTSNENYTSAVPSTTKKGVGSDFNYSGNMGRFSFRVSNTYGSKYYTNYRGILNTSYGVNYRRNEHYTWTFTNSFYQQNPVYLDQFGNESGGIKSRSNHYDLSLNVSDKASSYIIRGAYYDDDLSTIHYKTQGLGLDYRPSLRASKVRFYTSVFGSYINLPDYDIPDYFTAQARTSLRYNSFTANIRYNYGPYQAYEHLRFATTGINHQSIYTNFYYGFWLLDDRISLEPSLAYSYETLYKRGRVSLRPELFYFSKSGLQFSVYAEYLVNSQKIYTVTENPNFQNNVEPTVERNFTMGLGLKKQFGIPVPGKRFHSIQVNIFKDLNGNLIQDKNEESIENVLVSIKPVSTDSSHQDDSGLIDLRGENLITDAKGRVSFKNLPIGIYTITTKPLTENSGWFPGSQQDVVLNSSKELSLPFTQGVRLVGALVINHSTSATARNKTPEISRIRVTATDSAGRNYSGLTDGNGKFELYVPAGDYRISLNEKAVDDNYKIEQPVINVSLSGFSGTYNISFQLDERERNVKIKKFNNDGTPIETPEENEH